ncbi:hypothetical protein P280DRAFT_529774 [Massarina eburnea CBS 473.64]|uniref:RING-type domain-containing protein n=1 Tax=Massarina eburnea CBS 473.64 TaxID=1395130 RepID=A0A6A6RS96_9PLEO|nr:hypothetical protein P280DRAFT_529774 [Massarina eburnea CBS 473.64]
MSDIDVQPGRVAAPLVVKNEPISDIECVQLILNVLPDVSVDHLLSLISETARTPAACERIIARLLDGGTYPKEKEEAECRKRKRDSEDSGEFDGDVDSANDAGYFKDALALLKDEFLPVPVRHIEQVLLEHNTFFKAYGVLGEQLRTYQNIAHPFTKNRTLRTKQKAETMLIGCGSTIPKELAAVRRSEEKKADERRKAAELEQAEQENLWRAQRDGEMGECLCCYDDFPTNRMTSCDGDTIHFFCFTCAKKYVETEIGLGRTKPVCFADLSCNGTFARKQLQHFLGEKSFERLEHMKQQQDLAAAGLDFLSECPFCDYKAECPPVEVDKEFRCLNPKCRKVSCRLCENETHVPLSCEEFKKDNKLSVRHIVEEAMSAALIRSCNQCKHPFVKEAGCNKMTCTHCRNVQCYVCSKNVAAYDHFIDGQGGPRDDDSRCPLHDNVEARHEQEVTKAAEEARAKAQAENPDILEADLMIQVSDGVKRTEQSRQERAHAAHVQFPFQMAGGVVVRNGPPPAAVGIAPRHVLQPQEGPFLLPQLGGFEDLPQ